ncbi:MAG: helix-turn-helix domain-containing protein [Oscillospiraceae bacterium]|nr:helix-turn-helix domain-containing protein [Oscillospiraceae bacterium]
MDRKRIAGRLVRLRGGRSREEVAAAAGISLSALGMYESGARIPRDEIKLALAACYGVRVEDLFFR